MAAATTDRLTFKYWIEREMTLTLKANSVIPAGVMVCTDATGLAVNGADTAGLKMQGCSAHSADQTKGDTVIIVERGVFVWANDGTIAQANVGQLATILDNQTLSLAATTVNDIGAGWVEEIRSDGVAISVLGGRPEAA